MTDLSNLLQIRLAEGSVPVEEVMALALYHPAHGYYRRPEGPWGFEGKDYYTALDLGSLLGETLALRLASVWEGLGRPEVFTVLEPGAGRGWLGRDLLQAASGDFREALRYLHRDDNPAARALAREALAPFGDRVRFVGETESLEPFVGAVISNELFDALPAQPYRFTEGRWTREVLTADGPAWEPTLEAEPLAWFTAQGDGLEEGDGSVWSPALPSVVASCVAPLQAGLFLAIDYGERADRLLDKGADLRRFKGHQVDGLWHEDLGQADLTADVDFTRLAQHLEHHGLKPEPLQNLSRWVRTHAPLAQWEQGWLDQPTEVRMARMQNLLQLTLPGMMGDRFKVLEAVVG